MGSDESMLKNTPELPPLPCCAATQRLCCAISFRRLSMLSHNGVVGAARRMSIPSINRQAKVNPPDFAPPC